MQKIGLWICFIVTIICVACTEQSVLTEEIVELNHFPLDSMNGIITQSGVELDKENSIDGNGSLKITSAEGGVVKLLELSDLDLENARLIYQAKVSTMDVEGDVFLEMWVHLQGQGEFFSRNLQTPSKGTTGWTTMETLFFLKKGQNPDYVKLNLVMSGPGTAWIDDIRLVKGPLE